MMIKGGTTRFCSPLSSHPFRGCLATSPRKQQRSKVKRLLSQQFQMFPMGFMVKSPQEFCGNVQSTVGKVGWMVLNITGSLQMISPMVGHFPSPRPFSKPQRCVGSVLKQDDYVTEDERARIRNSSVLASLRAP